MRIARISCNISGFDGSAGRIPPLFEQVCEERGQCKFLGSDLEGNILTLSVSLTGSAHSVKTDARSLFEDLNIDDISILNIEVD